MSHPFDAVTKSLLPRYGRDIIRVFGGDDPGPVHLLPTDLSTATASADGVLAIGDPPRCAVNVEFVSSRQPSALPNALKFWGLLQAELHIPVLTMLVLLRREADLPNVTGVFEEQIQLSSGGHAWRKRIDFIRVKLWDIPADARRTGS